MKLKELLKIFRNQCLQRAKTAYANYHNDYDNLNSWLSRVPNYEPRETDDIQQIEAKLKNQRVSFHRYNNCIVILQTIFIYQNYVCNVQNLLSDITRKESDLNNVSRNAQLYQQAVKVLKPQCIAHTELSYYHVYAKPCELLCVMAFRTTKMKRSGLNPSLTLKMAWFPRHTKGADLNLLP